MQIIDMSEKYQRRIPIVGDILPAFDDGKIRPSRLYPVKVLEVLPWSEDSLDREFKMINFERYFSGDGTVEFGYFPLRVAWEEKYENHDWLFSDKTDHFIITDTGSSSETIEVFARTKSGGWFSISLMSLMTGSKLDSDMKLFNNWKGHEWYAEDYVENKGKFLMQE